MVSKKVVGVLVLGFVINFTKLLAFDNDSISKNPKVIKPPKNYFNNAIYADYYAPSKRVLDTLNPIFKKLKSYKFSQVSVGFNLPMFTKDFYNKDSTRISNIHLLITGGYTALRLNFEGISQHKLSKTFIGFRGVFNNGKKSIFFVEVAPFISQDNGYRYSKILFLYLE